MIPFAFSLLERMAASELHEILFKIAVVLMSNLCIIPA